MSSDYSVSARGAEAFNAKAAWQVGWGHALPLLDPDVDVGIRKLAAVWAKHGAGEAFTEAVADRQRERGLAVDGKFGRGSWREELRDLPTYSNGVRVADMHVPVPAGAEWEVQWGLDVDGDGVPDLLPGFSQGANERRRIVAVHWGGADARSCYNALYNRGLSTHFGCAAQLTRSGRLAVHQLVDVAHSAYHGGRLVNGHSVGIDLCRSPLPKYASRYPNAEEIDNPTSPRRGPARIVALEPEYGRVAGRFIAWVADLMDIPAREPYPGDGRLDTDDIGKGGRYTGILGHHHFSDPKWDVACWAAQLPCWRHVESTR